MDSSYLNELSDWLQRQLGQPLQVVPEYLPDLTDTTLCAGVDIVIPRTETRSILHGRARPVLTGNRDTDRAALLHAATYQVPRPPGIFLPPSVCTPLWSDVPKKLRRHIGTATLPTSMGSTLLFLIEVEGDDLREVKNRVYGMITHAHPMVYEKQELPVTRIWVGETLTQTETGWILSGMFTALRGEWAWDDAQGMLVKREAAP